MVIIFHKNVKRYKTKTLYQHLILYLFYFDVIFNLMEFL